MRDTKSYRAILDPATPWTMSSVDLNVKGHQVVVAVDAGPGSFRCPECQQEVAGYDRRPRHSRLWPMAEVVKLLRSHLSKVLTYLLRFGITPAGLEAVNATIQRVKTTVRAFRNPEHLETSIYFHSGGLDLYPHEYR